MYTRYRLQIFLYYATLSYEDFEEFRQLRENSLRAKFLLSSFSGVAKIVVRFLTRFRRLIHPVLFPFFTLKNIKFMRLPVNENDLLIKRQWISKNFSASVDHQIS